MCFGNTDIPYTCKLFTLRFYYPTAPVTSCMDCANSFPGCYTIVSLDYILLHSTARITFNNPYGNATLLFKKPMDPTSCAWQYCSSHRMYPSPGTATLKASLTLTFCFSQAAPHLLLPSACTQPPQGSLWGRHCTHAVLSLLPASALHSSQIKQGFHSLCQLGCTQKHVDSRQ